MELLDHKKQPHFNSPFTVLGKQSMGISIVYKLPVPGTDHGDKVECRSITESRDQRGKRQSLLKLRTL